MSTLILELIGLLCTFSFIFFIFDGFGVEHIPQEIKAFIGNKNIKTNIFRIQSYDLTMWGNFCIECIDFMLSGKNLTDFTNLFSTNNFKKKRWYNFKLFCD